MIDLAEAECVFVTGGCGFIGAEVVNQLLSRYPNLKVVNIDALTYAARCDRIEETPRYELIVERIEDQHAMRLLVDAYRPEAIIHLAAETHVDRSISGSIVFVDSNVKGTASILEAIKGKKTKLLYVSTDEVYGEAKGEREFVETDELNPRNPYSATKAAGEILVKAYANTFDIDYTITRGANTYGVGQRGGKLIPESVRRLVAGEHALLYGDGEHQREWLHVSDHASGIIQALLVGGDGRTFNIGSGTRATNQQVVAQIAAAVYGRQSIPHPFVEYGPDRLGHDTRYALDSSKLKETGWKTEFQGPLPLHEETLNLIIEAERAENPGILTGKAPGSS